MKSTQGAFLCLIIANTKTMYFTFLGRNKNVDIIFSAYEAFLE